MTSSPAARRRPQGIAAFTSGTRRNFPSSDSRQSSSTLYAARCPEQLKFLVSHTSRLSCLAFDLWPPTPRPLTHSLSLLPEILSRRVRHNPTHQFVAGPVAHPVCCASPSISGRRPPAARGSRRPYFAEITGSPPLSTSRLRSRKGLKA